MAPLLLLPQVGITREPENSGQHVHADGGKRPGTFPALPSHRGQPGYHCPKTGLFSSSLPGLPWKDPCAPWVDVLVVSNPPSQQNQFVCSSWNFGWFTERKP